MTRLLRRGGARRSRAVDVLEAAQAASTTGTTDPSAGAIADAATNPDSAELVSALQTLFSANAAGSGGSAVSMQKLIEMIG